MLKYNTIFLLIIHHLFYESQNDDLYLFYNRKDKYKLLQLY